MKSKLSVGKTSKGKRVSPKKSHPWRPGKLAFANHSKPGEFDYYECMNGEKVRYWMPEYKGRRKKGEIGVI